MDTVVLNGFGPHIRLKVKDQTANASIKVVTRDTVKTVPLATTTDINFTNLDRVA